MAYSVSNSEAVERAVSTVWTVWDEGGQGDLPDMVEGKSARVISVALAELQEKYDEQAAYIEQFERSYSQMMRRLDEAEAESNHG